MAFVLGYGGRQISACLEPQRHGCTAAFKLMKTKGLDKPVDFVAVCLPRLLALMLISAMVEKAQKPNRDVLFEAAKQPNRLLDAA